MQQFHQALLPLEESRPSIEILLDLARGLDQNLVYQSSEDLFMEWCGKQYHELDDYGEIREGFQAKPPSRNGKETGIRKRGTIETFPLVSFVVDSPLFA